MARVINFYAGPAALPVEVLKKAQEEMIEWRGTGMSVMEISHRSKEYEAMHNEAQALFKELCGMGENWQILFLQGGASTQFYMVPLNFLTKDKTADYILTGAWSQKALKEAKRITSNLGITTTEDNKVFRRIPKQGELKLNPKAEYVHVTSNNTIFGTQWREFPNTGGVPIFCDMSSDIFSRKFDPSKFGLIYAGAQKNLGPSGVTVVAIRKDMLEKANKDLPTMLAYQTHAADNSLYNTPPCYSIYILNLTLNWLKNFGGLPAMEKENAAKAKTLYDAIDGSGGYYNCPVEKDARSWMNVVFRLKSEPLEEKFAKDGKAAGFIGLKGHRSVGGIRVSMYNANRLDAVNAMVGFMKDFQKKNG
jgi:phosphoserine aminotransferase